jgi:hypothetical protein
MGLDVATAKDPSLVTMGMPQPMLMIADVFEPWEGLPP